MIERTDIENKKILGQWLLTLFFPLAIVGKVIRWTILRNSTAYMGIGHRMVWPIIRGEAHFAFSFQGGSPEGNADYIFSIFNLFNCRTYEEFEIGISIVFNIAIFLLVWWFIRRYEGLTKLQFVCLSLFVGVLNIYTFTLSKEAAQILYYALLFIVLALDMPVKKTAIWLLVVMLFMVFATRFYLVLMLGFAVGIYMVYPWLYRKLQGNTLKIMLVFLVVGAFTYYLFLQYCKAASPADFAEMIRVRTRMSDSTTDIRPWIPIPTLELFGVNYMILALRMLFPVELLRFGPKFFIYVLFQLIVSWYMIRGLAHFRDFNHTKKFAICLFWGFFFCSVTFEPDFGSWVRHESVTFPMLLFAFADNYADNESNDDDVDSEVDADINQSNDAL